ncbi:expressed unknown protein [Seminavis robusta]|uniref:Uncharacterized protein n=1 Tax=Seminavis robusta TaxID=568900 RepID=A0A9N8DL33_9STRA|nr:expressed unknown protein [Seminavis robusta]|eukprot:Sro144_g066830.1 n/a (366) ;mRNA; f:1933-3030
MMRDIGQENRGAGILTRRSSVAHRTHQQPSIQQVPNHYYPIVSTSTPVVSGTTGMEDDPYFGMWMYPELMDIVALVAALCLGVASTSLSAFSAEEIAPANERYLAQKESSTGPWSKGSAPVSFGIMIFCGLATSLSSLCLVLSVGARFMLTYIANLDNDSPARTFLLQWANPMSIVVMITWYLALGCAAGSFYWIGWVVFPPEIASSATIVAFGYVFVIGIALLFFFSIYVAWKSIRLHKKKKHASSTPQRIQETPIRTNQQQIFGHIVVEQEVAHQVTNQSASYSSQNNFKQSCSFTDETVELESSCNKDSQSRMEDHTASLKTKEYSEKEAMEKIRFLREKLRNLEMDLLESSKPSSTSVLSI